MHYDKFIVNTYEEYLQALKNTNTEMFWTFRSDIEVTHNLDLYFTHDNEYDRKRNHTFLHDDEDNFDRTGVWLCSKHTPLTKKEIEYRFVLNAKEHDEVASKRKYYDKFYIDNFADYETARVSSTTDMFWIIFNDVQELEDFNWKLYFPYKHMHDATNEFDRKINHTFVHDDEGEKTRGGVWLCSKEVGLGEKEVNYRFVVNAKEHDEVASKRKYYDKFVVTTYDDYEYALETTTTEMFWIIFNSVEPTQDFNWKLYFPYKSQFDKTNEYDRKINHTWIHQDGEEQLRNGVWLCSKYVPISKKELEYRFVVNAKEHDEIASYRKLYDTFTISSYNDYEEAYNNSTTDMFWAIYDDLEVKDESVFNEYFMSKHLYDETNDYDLGINHVYKNGKYNDGIVLCTTKTQISKREWNYGFIVNKKEVDVCASEPKPFDIVFISYNEPNADETYSKILKQYPACKRIHKVKGIHQAHIEAAKLCNTDMFWVIDGDAELVKEFNFTYQVPRWERDVVHVWRSINPITGLEYGYGGVKLLPTTKTINVDINSTDMTTSISSKFKAIPEVSNITKFNTDSYSAWRSAFRESVKLTLNGDKESLERLEAWLHPVSDADFRHDAKRGAEEGSSYAKENKDNQDALNMINNFDWLREKFNDKC